MRAYYKEQGLSFNMRFVLRPGVTLEEIENCLEFFEEEIKSKKEVIIYNMTDWDFIFINKAFDSFLKDKNIKSVESTNLEVKNTWQHITIKSMLATITFSSEPSFSPKNII